MLQYLGRYTHRVAISNHRLVSFADDQITWRRGVNADVASLHANPVAEMVYNARKQQELAEMSPCGSSHGRGISGDMV